MGKLGRFQNLKTLGLCFAGRFDPAQREIQEDECNLGLRDLAKQLPALQHLTWEFIEARYNEDTSRWTNYRIVLSWDIVDIDGKRAAIRDPADGSTLPGLGIDGNGNGVGPTFDAWPEEHHW